MEKASGTYGQTAYDAYAEWTVGSGLTAGAPLPEWCELHQ